MLAWRKRENIRVGDREWIQFVHYGTQLLHWECRLVIRSPRTQNNHNKTILTPIIARNINVFVRNDVLMTRYTLHFKFHPTDLRVIETRHVQTSVLTTSHVESRRLRTKQEQRISAQNDVTQQIDDEHCRDKILALRLPVTDDAPKQSNQSIMTDRQRDQSSQTELFLD